MDEQKTKEAKLYKSLDKLEALIQLLVSGDFSYYSSGDFDQLSSV